MTIRGNFSTEKRRPDDRVIDRETNTTRLRDGYENQDKVNSYIIYGKDGNNESLECGTWVGSSH